MTKRKSTVKAEPEPEYTIGEWKGLTQYRCAKCPFDTVGGEHVILEHIRQHHAPPPPKIVELPIVDRYGNLIRRVVEQEVEEVEDG